MCGFNDPRALEFDHIDPSLKSHGVMSSRGSLYKAGVIGRKLLIDEVRKCRILCANCHRIKTKDELDFKRRGVACQEERQLAYEQWIEDAQSVST